MERVTPFNAYHLRPVVPGTPVVEVYLDGVWVAVAANDTVTIDAAEPVSGELLTLQLRVTNTGDAALAVVELALSGPVNVTDPGTTVAPASIGRNNTGQWQVTLTPTAAGALALDCELETSAGVLPFTLGGTAAAGIVLGQWVNLRAIFNARNASATDPGAPTQAGTVTLNGLPADADSWAPDITTAADASGVAEAALWSANIDDVWGDATPQEVAVAIEVQAPGTVSTGMVVGAAVGRPSAFAASSVARYENAGSGRAFQGSDTDGNVAASGDADRVRGVVFMAPGSGSAGVGLAVAFGRDGSDAPVGTTPTTGKTDSTPNLFSTPQVSLLAGARAAVTGATGDHVVLAKAVAMPRIRKDGGAGWVDIPFPGAAGRIDPSGMYVSDSGAHATDWRLVLTGAAGYSAQGWTPSSGAKPVRVPVDLAALGIDLSGRYPIDCVVEPLGTWSTGSTIWAALLLYNGTNGYAGGILQASGSTRSASAWFNTQTFAAATHASITNTRALWVPTIGATGSKYLGCCSPIPYTDTGPYPARNGYTNGTSYAGDLQAEIVVAVASGGGTPNVDFRAQVRNVALDMTEAAVAA